MRGAWPVGDTFAGANTGAVFSIIATVKANGLTPYAWLRCIMHDLPAAKTVKVVEVLLRWNLSALGLTNQMAA